MHTPGKIVTFELLWLVLLGVLSDWGQIAIVACGLVQCKMSLTLAHNKKSNFLSVCKLPTQITGS